MRRIKIGTQLTELERVRREAQGLADAFEWQRCFEVALRAMNLTASEALGDWIDLRLIFASAAVELLEAGEMFSVEDAIGHISEIIDASGVAAADERRGYAHLQLGQLFDKRSSGNLRDDKAAAVAHWEKAAEIFDADTQPMAWAASRECAGVATLEIVNTLLEMREFTMPGVVDFAAGLVEHALRAFVDAARVYSRSIADLDKLANVEALSRSAQEMLSALRS